MLKTSTEYGKIFHNMPIPPRGFAGSQKYDFSQLNVGDSILLPHTAAGCIPWAEKHHGFKLVKRAIDTSSIMIWRVK
jgi:hypothetical protein